MAHRNGFSELAKLLLRYSSSEKQAELKHILLRNYPQDTLIGLLRHEVAPTRRAAAYALGLIGDATAAPALLETLHHIDLNMRANAEQALWAIWFRSGDEHIDRALKEGVNHIEKKQYGKAVDKLTEVILSAPAFPEGYNQRAVAYYMLEEWEKSIDDCKKAVKLNPVHFGAFAGMGHCYLRLGKLNEAIDAYQKALEINPNLFAVAHTILQIQNALRERYGRK
jgi:tetratricopeptide (TPR) repeat protein